MVSWSHLTQRLFVSVAIVKKNVLIFFFSQSTQLKFNSLNTWSKFSRIGLFSGSLFSRINGKFTKTRSRENFMPHGCVHVLALESVMCHTNLVPRASFSIGQQHSRKSGGSENVTALKYQS